MIRNYFISALRNFNRNRKFFGLNIIGLAIGMAVCLLIALFIYHEFSYDRYNKKADRIVRVVFKGETDGQKIREANVMPPVAATMKADFPEVEMATRLVMGGSPIISYDNKSFKEDAFAYVDPNFFQVFTLPLIMGDAKTALIQPNTIVITKAIAKKYFGNQDPIGKILNFKTWNTSYKVTGVINKVPQNSTFHFDFFASMESWPDSKSSSFMTSGYYTYLLLAKGFNYKELQPKLTSYTDKYFGPQFPKAFGMTFSEFRKKGNNIGLYLQPLTDIHLYSDFTNDIEPEGNIAYVYIFGAIALFMLLIACINFMNLSTAGASKRAKEVGIRKVVGSSKRSLVLQFMTESILLAIFSFILAGIIVSAVLPFFNNLSGKELNLHILYQPLALLVVFLFVLFVGILAGSYPAFILSSFKPILVLKGTLASGRRSMNFRRGLVVFQFFISIVLIISTMVIYKQLRYARNIPLGYNKSNVLILPEAWLLGRNESAFYQELLQDPKIEMVSESGYLPAGPSYNNNFFLHPAGETVELVKTLRYDVDYNYIPVMGMKMISGRNFSKQFGTDSIGIIINQAAAKAFGWKGNATGRTLTHRDNNGAQMTYTVIGVVKDFHFRSLYESISPLVMVLGQGAGTIIVKYKTGNISNLLSDLNQKWNALSPESSMTYSFLDDRVRRTYASEQRTAIIITIFSALAILVACIGLFGLVMYSAEQRTKEIGIRKVLGASVNGIVALLSKEFVELVLIGFVIASPIAWWVMNKWLQNFAYRININWWIFLVAGMAAVLLALVTVSFQAIKAAVANPVESLRTE